MLEFIAQYWLNFLLTLISGALVFACRKTWTLYQAEKNHQKTAEQEAFYEGLKDTIREGAEESKKGDEILQKQIDIIKSGILSIQKKIFKQECRELLREGRILTLEEFEALQEEHNIYNSLGGNHDGDALFGMVREKATNQLSDNK